MPLGRMMEGRNFDSKSAVILVEAFNEIIDELDLRTIADREKAAKIVVELAASKTALDVAELRDEAVDLIRKGDVTLGHTVRPGIRPNRETPDGRSFDQLGGLQGDLRDSAVARGAAASD